MGIGQLIDAVEERQNLAIILQEADNRFVQTRQLFIRLIAAGVMGRTAVEDITTAIARLVLRNAFSIRETLDTHHQRALGIVL